MNRRISFLIGLLVQLIAVFGLFVPSIMIQATGTPVTLRTVPVDPWSLFRGQYVVLSYEAGQETTPYNAYGQLVFVVLQDDDQDGVYERTAVVEQRPVLEVGQVCLRGTRQYNQIIFPDIAQYFVEEGGGTDIESAARDHRLLVDLSVAGNCRAVINGVRIGQEYTPEEQDRLRQGLPVTDVIPREAPERPIEPVDE